MMSPETPRRTRICVCIVCYYLFHEKRELASMYDGSARYWEAF